MVRGASFPVQGSQESANIWDQKQYKIYFKIQIALQASLITFQLNNATSMTIYNQDFFYDFHIIYAYIIRNN